MKQRNKNLNQRFSKSSLSQGHVVNKAQKCFHKITRLDQSKHLILFNKNGSHHK